jgi:hypothetical protein
MSTATTQRATLRASVPSFAGVEVDEAAGVIRNASVMTIGPAIGHGFELDQTSLQQLVESIGGGEVQVRFKHPKNIGDDSLGTDVGFLKNVRIDGAQVRGDIHLQEYAKALPGIGDAWTYLLSKAKNAPASFGLSAVIDYEVEPVQVDGTLRLMARICGTEAVDFVGRPAANPGGLLSVAQPEKSKMDFDPKYKPAMAQFGLPSDATDDQAAAFFAALPADKQAACAAAPPPPNPNPEKPVDPVQNKPSTPPAQMSVATLAETDTVALEAKRVTSIRQLAATLPLIGEKQINDAIGADLDVAGARKAFLAHISANASAVPSISVGEDRRVASLAQAIPDALRIRAGVVVPNAHEMAHRLASLTMLEQFRHYLTAHGVKEAAFFGQARLAELFTSRRQRAALAQSTSDFDNILLDAANKTLRNAYVETPVAWNVWARKNTNPDFKAGNRLQLSEAGMPVERKEGGELKYNTLTDSKTAVTLTEYVNGIRLTRRAVINDDTSAFARIPQLLGNSYKRLEDYLAFSVLTANATLAQTGGALFNSTPLTNAAGHANLISSGGGAPTVTTLGATSALMRKQKGLKKTTADNAGAFLNTQPVALIVPVALEVVAAQLVGSNVDPAKSNSTKNPYFNALTVVSHPLLDENSAVAWYMAADPNLVDGVEVCFLQDEQAPVLKNETDFDTDDVKFASRHTVTAAAIDYRGLAKNPGQ